MPGEVGADIAINYATGDWVAEWIVRCSAALSYTAIMPRVSIGTGSWRCTQMLA